MERAYSTIQVVVSCVLLVFGTAVTGTQAQEIRGEALANELRNNVVRVIARWSDGSDPGEGFGFVVGERAGLVYIATADHVVRDGVRVAVPGIVFFQDRGKEYRGDLLITRLAPVQGDLAVIRVPPPAGFSWRREALANIDPSRGADVWFIGLAGNWHIPARPGAISSVEPNGTIRFEDINVRSGASGAPLIGQTGILGMVVTAGDVFSEATPIGVLERAFRSWQYPWQVTTTLTRPSPAPQPPSTTTTSPPSQPRSATTTTSPPPQPPSATITSPPPQPRAFACEKQPVIAWLQEHGAYDGKLDPSIYDDQVQWIVGGKPSVKTRSEIAKDEEDFRKAFPLQKYTAQTSSIAVVGGQCVLTQQLDSYKRRSNGKEEYSTFRVLHTIRIDAKGPRIVAQQIDVLPRR